jgi:hypothetical protein
MPSYTPPLRDMHFVLHEVLHTVDELKQIPRYADLDTDTLNAVLEEGGKFAAEVTQPLNLSGDSEGCTLDKATHEVATPKGFKAAYAQYVEGGWPALSCDPEYGGQGLPLVTNQCFYEMLNSANQAWTMYPGLSHGAYEALHAHGTGAQKKTYLPKLTSGVWTGTMCLTEPHCGTDLGLLRSKAEPQADGSYKITGNKIFISAPASTTWPRTSSTWCWPACPTRPLGQRASACSWCRSSWSRPTAAWASATRCSAAPGAQDGHPRQRHLRRSRWTAPPAPWSASPTRAWPPCS